MHKVKRTEFAKFGSAPQSVERNDFRRDTNEAIPDAVMRLLEVA